MSRFARMMATVFAENDAPVYTNLLSANVAGCESLTGWASVFGTLALDSDNEYDGIYCIKNTIDATRTSSRTYYQARAAFTQGKYYMFSGYVNKDTCTNIRAYVECQSDAGVLNGSLVTGTGYDRSGVLVQPADFDGVNLSTGNLYVGISVTGVAGNGGFQDKLMLNEITAADYAAGVAACLTKYPYKAP